MTFLHQFLQCGSLFAFRVLPVITLLVFITPANALNINFGPDSVPRSESQKFKFFGDSDLISIVKENSYRISALQITRDSLRDPTEYRSGRAMYRKTFKLWRKNRSILSSFRTTFELMIKNGKNESAAEGMAFILTNRPELPADSEGLWLGITNREANGSSSKTVAIEFDTHKSYDDDLDDNHVSVNVRGIVPLIQVPLSRHNVNLSSDDSNKFVEIRYNGTERLLTVYVKMIHGSRLVGHGDGEPVVSLPVDLSEFLDEDVSLGFSASTGNLVELNYVMSWTFVGDEEDTNPIPLPILLSCTLLFISGCGFGSYYVFRRRKRVREVRRRGGPSPELQKVLEMSTRGPRKFRLRELRSATMNFSHENKLGRGGFGTVYRGYLKETGEVVAVKRVSEKSRQGQQEFVAEVTTIGRLSHKNLVKLIGWCYERNELLLVYEIIPNGSLDKFLFANISAGDDDEERALKLISWEKRIEIIRGVASALYYLHEGCHGRILHRDVKASNVMLDSDYNARLGDFGLARTIQLGGTHHATDVIAGTPGYIAPEFGMTGRATVETDVYGFGVLVLEVACGRKPRSKHGVFHNDLLNWVWDLHEQRRVVDAADPRLRGEFEKEEMERALGTGLSCCHPDPKKRPSMRLILQILSGEAAPLILPPDKPSFRWPLLDSDRDRDLSSFEISFDEEQVTEFRSAVESSIAEDPISYTQMEIIFS